MSVRHLCQAVDFAQLWSLKSLDWIVISTAVAWTVRYPCLEDAAAEWLPSQSDRVRVSGQRWLSCEKVTLKRRAALLHWRDWRMAAQDVLWAR